MNTNLKSNKPQERRDEMAITTEQAVKLAKGVGAEEDWGSVFQMNRKDLTALCNAVRKQTLLEAVHEFQTESMYGFADTIEFLRRMAGEE